LIALRDWKKYLDKAASKAGDLADKAVCSAWGAAITMDASITSLRNNTVTVTRIYPEGNSTNVYIAERGPLAGMLMSNIGTAPAIIVLAAAEAALYLSAYKAMDLASKAATNEASKRGSKRYRILEKPIVSKLPVYGLMLWSAYKHYEGLLSWM